MHACSVWWKYDFLHCKAVCNIKYTIFMYRVWKKWSPFLARHTQHLLRLFDDIILKRSAPLCLWSSACTCDDDVDVSLWAYGMVCSRAYTIVLLQQSTCSPPLLCKKPLLHTVYFLRTLEDTQILCFNNWRASSHHLLHVVKIVVSNSELPRSKNDNSNLGAPRMNEKCSLFSFFLQGWSCTPKKSTAWVGFCLLFKTSKFLLAVSTISKTSSPASK